MSEYDNLKCQKDRIVNRERATYLALKAKAEYLSLKAKTERYEAALKEIGGPNADAHRRATIIARKALDDEWCPICQRWIKPPHIHETDNVERNQ